MPFCPACGATNPEEAKFCHDCRTRLESGHGRARVDNSPEYQPPPAHTSKPLKLDLARLSVWLGITGIPGIIVGAMLIKRQGAARGRPLAAVIIGSGVTLIIIAALAGAFRPPDPLRRHLTVDGVPAFADALTARVDQLQEQAEAVRLRLGPGAESELAPFHSRISQALNLAGEMESVENEEELDSLRDLVLEELDGARDRLSGR
jgi:hypothetical protein